MIINGPFRGSEALAYGLVTRGRLAGPSYRRVFADVYVPAGLAVDLRVRSLAAYVLVRGGGGVLAGYSAANLLGADCAPVGAPAEVLGRRKTRACPGLLVRNGSPGPDDLVEAAGCVATSPARTAWDLCRRLPLVEAVVALDALSHAGGFAPVDLLERRAARPGARGCRRLDDVVALADPRAESPPETRLRLELGRAGLPAPEVQYEITDEYGFLLARLDLAYPEARLAIEYDGSMHFTRRQGERIASATRSSPPGVGRRAGSGATTSGRPRRRGVCAASWPREASLRDSAPRSTTRRPSHDRSCVKCS